MSGKPLNTALFAPSDLECALAASGDAIYIWDVATDTMTWLGPVAKLLGVTDTMVATGKDFAARINLEDAAERERKLSTHFQAQESFECEYRIRSQTGSFCWVQDRGFAEFDEIGQPARMRGVLRAVTSRKAREASLEQRANFDELTGHFNRNRLRDSLDHMLATSVRMQISGGYLAVGIDKTTMLNSALGSEIADTVIVEVGHRLDRCLRVSDVIGRVGGDRFGVVLANCDTEQASAVADKVLRAINQTPVQTIAGPVYVTVSIGLATFPEQARTPYDIMTRAEAALNEAKRAGRDCYFHYRLSDAQRAEQRNSLGVGEKIRRALEQDRLCFAFQPVVQTETGAVDYYECLLRMVEDDGRIVSAGAFVPIIEQLGFIRLIDRQVLEKTVQELERHKQVTLGLNISGLTATDRSWLRTLISLLKGRPEIAQRLVVEITETAALYDIEESARFVKTLRDIGCRVALDDFGAGFTSLRHLQALAVDTVKIDGSFVRNLADNEENQVFVRHLLGLTRGFGLHTVAECVENAREAAILRNEGVGFLQGYYFGKPSVDRPWLEERGELALVSQRAPLVLPEGKSALRA